MSNRVLGEQAYAGQPGKAVLDTILLTLECKDALEYTAPLLQ